MELCASVFDWAQYQRTKGAVKVHLLLDRRGLLPSDAVITALCANICETSSPSTITVGWGKKSHLDEHKQDKYFFRCVGSFGA